MKTQTGPHILASIPRDKFVGRAHELDRLLTHARSGEGSVISLLKAPGSGATELLRQVYDLLFYEGAGVIPVYFAFSRTETDPLSEAQRFQREFLAQVIAFRRNEPSIAVSADGISDLGGMVPDEDREWFSAFDGANQNIRSLLAGPLRSSRLAGRLFVMMDDLDNAALMRGGNRLVSDLIEIAEGSGVPYVIAGARRFLFGKARGAAISFGPPGMEDTAAIATTMAERFGVELNDQTRDLVAVQMSGNLRYMELFFTGAAARGDKFDNFAAVEASYAEEIFGGRLARFIESRFDEMVPDKARSAVWELMRNSIGAVSRVSAWRSATELEPNELRRMMDQLHVSELINRSGSTVEVDAGNTVLVDHINGRARLGSGEPRALVFGEKLSSCIKRAPQLLGRYYRRKAALSLKSLLSRFNGQEVPAELIDYTKFKERVKGLSETEAGALVQNSTDRMKMPAIFFAADTSAFYKRLSDLIDDERSAIALGFEGESGLEETVWIAAQIDSKLEADAELAEFWCDRLEMAAANCGFDKFTIWLVAPEGFTAAAMELLSSRRALGSSRRQLEMLRETIYGGTPDQAAELADEYELIIPMGDDTEMIAARTLEDIARKHELPSKMINQVKTALVEACINAVEHSMSPDRRIYQKFTIDGERLTVTVANRGLRLLDRTAATEVVPDEGRRGWGLKLMKSLMDEVKIESTDDGTRITMAKYLGSTS